MKAMTDEIDVGHSQPNDIESIVQEMEMLRWYQVVDFTLPPADGSGFTIVGVFNWMISNSCLLLF